MSELKIYTVKYSLILESGILQANHHNIKQQTLNNLRQSQQCSLPQTGHLKDDNIFSFV